MSVRPGVPHVELEVGGVAGGLGSHRVDELRDGSVLARLLRPGAGDFKREVPVVQVRVAGGGWRPCCGSPNALGSDVPLIIAASVARADTAVSDDATDDSLMEACSSPGWGRTASLIRSPISWIR